MNNSRKHCCLPSDSVSFLLASILLLSTLCGMSVSNADTASGTDLIDTTAIGPFAITNYNPLPQMFGFPRDYVTRVLPDRQSHYALVYDRSSFYTLEDTPVEQLLFDGESTHTTFIYQRGVGNQFQWGIVIPYVSFSGGSLDSFIIDWHDTFHLPQSGRDIAARNMLRLYYQRNGITQFDVTRASAGIGDVAVNASMAIGAMPPSNAAANTLNLSLKLPSGDAAQLHGSGAVDIALWLSGHRSNELFDSGYRVFGRLGLLAMGKADVMSEQQRRLLAFGGIGAGIRYNQTIRFKTQIDFHTALYKDSTLSQLGRYAMPLTMGGEIAFGKHTRLDIGVTEDLYVDVSPDVSFHLGLYTAF